jgi:hypothetical protein
MMGFRKLLTVVATAIVVAACAKNSDGSLRVGLPGSPTWFASTEQMAIDEYMDNLTPAQICSKLANFEIEERPGRQELHIAAERSLQKRSMSAISCSGNIEFARLRKEVDSAKRDAQRARNEAAAAASAAERNRPCFLLGTRTPC